MDSSYPAPTSIPDFIGTPTLDSGVQTVAVTPVAQTVSPPDPTAPHLPGHGAMHPSMSKRIAR